ncbi:MAG: dephospho-CoA kinase [Alicyclobacillus sp. RIFOXYA1_FULL_53_8]|nr:MAG: dephospho-CoA kinase [Alicyclobacillus sp. RIFOXYA1_FULL_53_8]
MFRQLGAYVVDADLWARKVVEPGRPALKEIADLFATRYEASVLNPDGTLHRAAVGAVVFHNEEARQALNALTHPRIREGMKSETEQFFAEHPNEPILWDVPLLFEGETRKLVDLTILVYVNADLQRIRLMARDGLSLDEANARIQSQMAIEAKRNLADYIVDNTGSLEQTKEQVERIWQILRDRAKEGAGG